MLTHTRRLGEITEENQLAIGGVARFSGECEVPDPIIEQLFGHTGPPSTEAMGGVEVDSDLANFELVIDNYKWKGRHADDGSAKVQRDASTTWANYPPLSK
eukprot:Em0019g259a